MECAMSKIDYKDRPRPIHYLPHAVVCVVVAAPFVVSIFPLLISRSTTLQLVQRSVFIYPGRALFVAYAICYFCAWIVYFNSICDWANIQSLRKLLHDHSKFWEVEHSGDVTEEDTIKALREKGRVTITSLAIIVAASTLLTTKVIESLLKLMQQETNRDADYYWSLVILYMSLCFAVAAFILLIIAVDQIDTTFNEFAIDKLKIVRYFYIESLHPKYFGLMCIVCSFVLYISFISAEVAAFAIALFACLGYNHLFPNIYSDSHKRFRFLYLIPIFIPLILLFARLK
jgi:hypothetical protein